MNLETCCGDHCRLFPMCLSARRPQDHGAAHGASPRPRVVQYVATIFVPLNMVEGALHSASLQRKLDPPFPPGVLRPCISLVCTVAELASRPG